ncbi:MAG: hypothetical protein Q4A71_08070 [Actinomycetaceae bacterium]|nr:hypothetical protein [Actinomycetaceae bacterium]
MSSARRPRKNAAPKASKRRRPAVAGVRRRRRGKAEIWARRSLGVLVVLGLLAVVGGGLYLGSLKYRDFMAHLQKQADKAQAEKQLPKPATCKSADLDFRVDPPAKASVTGSSVEFTVSLKNRGVVPCVTEGSFAHLGVLVKSGDEQIFGSAPCFADYPSRKLLLDKGQTWTKQLTWNGRRADAKCSYADAATNGTYRVYPVLDGKIDKNGERVFQILPSGG